MEDWFQPFCLSKVRLPAVVSQLVSLSLFSLSFIPLHAVRSWTTIKQIMNGTPTRGASNHLAYIKRQFSSGHYKWGWFNKKDASGGLRKCSGSRHTSSGEQRNGEYCLSLNKIGVCHGQAEKELPMLVRQDTSASQGTKRRKPLWRPLRIA